MEIGIWGDSITFGECDSEALGWVGRLRKALLDSANVYNRGVCGDTTEDLLKRFSVEADSLEPSQIVFAIGINDSKFLPNATENNIPLERFKENMKELLSRARKYTDQITLVGPTRVYEQRDSKSGTRFVNEEIQKYEDSLKELAQTEGLTFISLADALNIDGDLDDGLHPNAQGYEKMFKVIFEQWTK